MTGRVRGMLQKAATGGSGTLAARMRRRRFEHVRSQLVKVNKPYVMLDVGGTVGFWQTVGMCGEPGVEVTLLNLKPTAVDTPGFVAVAGDATSMPQYADKQFDVVFSNSVIEHVGDIEDQRRMADEVRRIGRRYYVQTPNRYFPMEPHFLFPFFGVMPIWMRAFLLRHLPLGWYSRIKDRDEARRVASSIRLLTRREVLALFPDGQLVRERFFGLTKSYSIYGGEW